MTETALSPAPTTSRTRAATVGLALVRRWPTALAVLLSALSWGGGVAGYTVILPLLPAFYALMLAVSRRRLTWPLLLVGMHLLVSHQSLLDPHVVVLAVAGAALGLAAVHGRGRHEVVRQAVGVLVFGGLAVLGAVLVPDVAVWLIAAGWLGHGLWDFWHLHRDAVVSRSFAEWCGVVDVLVAVELVLYATSWSS